ncbi:MAG TPA: pyruvate formate lyase-activating protein [Phycisphaerales bacterium]|nr:pyruvate formate lyase-activating protein [Phycisphaerales bacterium]
MTGRVHSIETLGALDGPGLRVVVFLQGCPLRCLYCHNPDTWSGRGGQEWDATAVVDRVLRSRPYFTQGGGVTLSGGEPLVQARFAAEILRRCREAEIHTALDTAGAALTPDVRRALDFADLVLLDVKHADAARHRALTSGKLATTLAFLRHVDDSGIDLWVRQVIVPGWNDSPDDLRRLAGVLHPLRTLRKIELLPYHAMARAKYAAMDLACPLEGLAPPDEAMMARCRATLTVLLDRPVD